MVWGQNKGPPIPHPDSGAASTAFVSQPYEDGGFRLGRRGGPEMGEGRQE